MQGVEVWGGAEMEGGQKREGNGKGKQCRVIEKEGLRVGVGQ